MDLRAEKKSLKNLLGLEEEQFRIPPYQRPYSWTSEQVDDLWDDVLENAATGHFLGSLVLADERESQPQVIDGQQRITTLMVLLAALRDACRARGMDRDAQRIQTRLLSDAFAHGDDQYKFKTGAANWQVFRDFVLREIDDDKRRQPTDTEGLSAHQKDRNKALLGNLVRMSEHIESELDKRNPDQQQIWLSRFSANLMENVEVVVIRVKELADAFLLFETLNDRGLQLSAADLLKSHLLGQFAKAYSSEEQVDEAAAEWDALLEDLGADVDVSRFLRHYLLGYQQAVKKDDVFGHFKALIAKQDPQRVLDELRTVARLYGEFEAPSRVEHPPTREALSDLRTLRAMTCYIALLPARRYLSETDFVAFARLAEILTYRYTSIVGLGTNDLERRYRDAAQVLIRSEGADLEIARKILIETMPDSATFRSAFMKMRMGTQYFLRYTLSRIEEHLDTGREKVLKPNQQVHIEHIMPKALTDEWRATLGVEGVEVHGEFLNKYGNLTLLYYADNIPASNKSFTEKKEYYRGSDVRLTRELTDIEDWGIEEVQARQARLAELADEVWAIPSPAGAQPLNDPAGRPVVAFRESLGDLWPYVEPMCVEVSPVEVLVWADDVGSHLQHHAEVGPEAAELAVRLKRLVDRWDSIDAHQRPVLAGAVKYFLQVEDHAHDEGADGLTDDRRVVEAAEWVLTGSGDGA